MAGGIDPRGPPGFLEVSYLVIVNIHTHFAMILRLVNCNIEEREMDIYLHF